MTNNTDTEARARLEHFADRLGEQVLSCADAQITADDIRAALRSSATPASDTTAPKAVEPATDAGPWLPCADCGKSTVESLGWSATCYECASKPATDAVEPLYSELITWWHSTDCPRGNAACTCQPQPRADYPAAPATDAAMREALAGLLAVVDGVPMSGVEAQRRADMARRALNGGEG